MLRARLGKAARTHAVSSLDRLVCARTIAPLFGAALPAQVPDGAPPDPLRVA